MKRSTEKNKYKSGLIAAAVLLLIAVLCSCGKADKRAYPKTVSELNGLNAGVMTGSIMDQIVEEKFPDSKPHYVNTDADLIVALRTGKTDYFLTDRIYANNEIAHVNDIEIIDEPIDYSYVGYVFKKNSSDSAYLREQMNEFIKKRRADGTIDKLLDKWCYTPETVDNAPAIKLNVGSKGVVRMAAPSTSPPFAYVTSDGGCTGLDIEIANLFCQEYDYELEIVRTDFNAIIPAVVQEMADFGGCSLSITPERQESVDFSDPYMVCELVAVVMKGTGNDTGIDKIVSSFRRTFVVEGRWKMILKGIGVSLLIAALSTLFGTLLGFAIYMICRKGNKIANLIFDKLAWVFSGIPVIVVLMVLYYIVFAEIKTSGTAVAVIAFTIIVTLSTYSLLKTAVKSIGRDQIEGAYSLGFSDVQTFFGIVLPQAMTQFIPNYSSMIISMFKGTAVVGYIAVQDLTKVSDIIRSRTFEPFFPLIATAVIYLIFVYIITKIIDSIAKKYEPKRRTDEQVLERFRE